MTWAETDTKETNDLDGCGGKQVRKDKPNI